MLPQKFLQKLLVPCSLALLCFLAMPTVIQAAPLVPIEDAVDMIGQYVDPDADPLVLDYTGLNPNSGAGAARATTFSAGAFTNHAIAPVLDTVNDRLFVADSGNNRVLVFNLDSSHRLIDRVADYVLGQPNFASSTASTTQTGMSRPVGLAFDPINNRLFVADGTNSRILVFDTATITNGEPAVNVLGKSSFTTASGIASQTIIRLPKALAYSTTTGYLFAASENTRTIYVYNTADGITNGEAAISVIGNSIFASYSGSRSQSTFGSTPTSLAIDEVRQKLFVAESIRILVFDAATTTNGRSAVNVLGQSDYTGFVVQPFRNAALANSLVYSNNRLITGEFTGIKIFDVTEIVDNEPAIAFSGKQTFESQSNQSNSAASSTSTLDGMLAYDEENELLYMGQRSYSRLAIFNAGPDTTAPALSSATTSTDGTTIYLQYSEFLEDITIGAPTSTDYIITINGATSSPVSVTIASPTIILVSTTTIYQGDTVTISYIAGDNSVRDYSGNEAINLTNTTVTNLSTVTDPNAPVEPDPEPEPTPSRRRSGGGRVVRTPTTESTPSSPSTPLPTPVSPTLPPSTTRPTVFTRNLTSGTTGEDVRTLQRFLNSQGYTVATQGNGSNGQETTYFGRATEAALKQFQLANNITPTGTMGPLTQARIAELTANAPATPVTPTQPTTPTAPQTTTPSQTTYTRDLTIGSRGSDVTALQNFLIQQGYLESGFATGYFGQLTQAALIKFQQANNISPAVGYFGAKTRGVVGR